MTPMKLYDVGPCLSKQTCQGVGILGLDAVIKRLRMSSGNRTREVAHRIEPSTLYRGSLAKTRMVVFPSIPDAPRTMTLTGFSNATIVSI